MKLTGVVTTITVHQNVCIGILRKSMGTKAIEFLVERDKMRWLKWLAMELQKTEKNFPTLLLPNREYPEWVGRVEGYFVASIAPVIKSIDVEQMSPKIMGRALGHSCALAVWMVELFEENFKKLSADIGQTINSQSFKIQKLSGKYRWDKWYHSMQLLAKNALRSSVDQSYEVMSDFLAGFSDGFSRKPKTFTIGNVGNTNCEIYLILLICWESIQKLKSVRELHEVLVRCLGLRAGNLKRTEQMCQRIGLSFGKPGRPRKPQTIQTPA